MPRALIVTSMFLPYLAADAHRARLLAGGLPGVGWEVELLVPGSAFQSSLYFEPHSELLSAGVPVHRAMPEWQTFFRWIRFRSLAWRAYRPLRRLGDSLLASGRFDLVYISCAQPSFFHLGVGWRRRFNVPFLVDIHDPWYSAKLGRTRHLPGLKRRAANVLARFLERATLKRAAGLISVSADYLETVNRRYAGRGWGALSVAQQAVLPFAASEDDLRAAGLIPATPLGDEPAPARTIVYTGAGGTIMEESFAALCRLLVEVRERAPERLSGFRIELLGTEPAAAGGSPVLSRVIAQHGLADLISESPSRLSYLEALRRVTEADGLLILGVSDPAYCPSKLFLYAQTRKPLLACMVNGSTVDSYFLRDPLLGHLVHFGPGEALMEAGASGILDRYLGEVTDRCVHDRSTPLPEASVSAMSARHAELFARCCLKERST